MATKRSNKKQALRNATIRLVARHGVGGTTVRRIAREAGVTEGALYRHYSSKAALCRDIYTQIIGEMIRAKEAIAASDAPIREKLAAWVRVSFASYDQHPDAFTFVLLTPHELSDEERPIANRQGEIFMELVRRAQAAGQLKRLAPELALSHFTGVMLNVPRQINAGALPAPASQYAPAVVEAVWSMLRAES